MASSPSLLGAAVRHGLVPARDVRAGLVRVRAVSRSNAVHVIEHDGAPVGYVKQAGEAARLDGDDTVGVEAALLGAIAPLHLAPTLILQGGSGSVWMAALPGEELSSVRDPAVLRPAAVDLGRALARLHRHPIADVGVPEAPRPWPLLDRLPPSMEGGTGRSEATPILDALTDPTIQRALDVARTQWRPHHLVHGDVSPGNVIVHTSSSGDVRIGLIDLELGGKGCPEHDLASAAAMLGEFSPGGVDLAALCLDAYWTACGPATLTAPWRCVRALLTAWQVALTHGEDGTPDVARILGRAVAAAEEVRS
ncbi:aminoglycoside phosphotransferase family protein [Knoellia sp. S7-12]|uniref:phosphotransferase family protein n=1 Tax=Knoellia sp. S7-12 TaxID=3126698 RepID=UPI0033666299